MPGQSALDLPQDGVVVLLAIEPAVSAGSAASICRIGRSGIRFGPELNAPPLAGATRTGKGSFEHNCRVRRAWAAPGP